MTHSDDEPGTHESKGTPDAPVTSGTEPGTFEPVPRMLELEPTLGPGASEPALVPSATETSPSATETSPSDLESGPERMPMRWLPGVPIFVASGFFAFALMANHTHLRGGVALGALFCLIATLALLDVIGCFDRVTDMVVVVARPGFARWLSLSAFSAAAFVIATRLAVAGTLPGDKWLAALLIPLTLLTTLASVYQCVAELGLFEPTERSALRHPSFWLLAISIGVYAPLLGSFSLIDPWETHYGEVAREILSRDDWISLWWAQDGWFWSKPILDFWLQALSFALFDVGYAPDAMLSAVALGRHPYPEWAARLPMLLMSLLGQVLLYAGVRRSWGRRAAFIGSLVLMSAPSYALIVHQSMTDLPYIAALMGAMGLFLLGVFSPPDAPVRGYSVRLGRRSLVLSAQGLVLGTIVLFALPQILYLASRNLGLVTTGQDIGFYSHLDRFLSGSAGGNCGLPGNEACVWHHAANERPQPAASAVFWAVCLAVFLWIQRSERRVQRLYFLAAWIFVSLSFMAKGLPGPVIAVASLAALLFMTRRFAEFERFELPSAVLVFAVVALPWFVQMTVRHGPGFLERLFVHDMYKRAFLHVHDTNAGDDTSIRYYLWQLGYGLFPATGVVALTSLGSLTGPSESQHRGQATASFLLAWFLVGFSMFTLTLTKFHHYVIAVVPPICLLTGPYLARMLDGTGDFDWRRPRTWWQTRVPAASNQPELVQRVLLVLCAAWTTWMVAWDLVRANASNGPVRFINLVTYQYTRPWPAHLSMAGVLWGVTIAILVVTLCWLGPSRLRAFATLGFLLINVGFCGWLCNGYLPRIAPHWGQRETIAEYYRRRQGPDEPLVAYQMNWKGENFYTGNRIPAFITTGDNFRRYVDEQRAKGQSVLFFTLEPIRIGNLKAELGTVARVDVLTDSKLNNKFVLARVQL